MSEARRPALMTLDEAIVLLEAGAAAARIVDVETVSTFDALGRVLAADLVSPIDVPPADNSSMDGYAVRGADVPVAGTVLRVSQRIAAGHVGAPLAAGSAARIFTGAQIPMGADAVVMQEQCDAIGDTEVRINVLPAPGQWIRHRGEDVMQGSTVLPRGMRLTPQAMGLAATVGAATLPVWRRPRVAMLSTGDELVMPGTVAPADLPPGAIFNSNRFMLRGLLQAAGCEVTDLGIVPDRLAETRDALRHAAVGHDLILSSGGVSVGEEDHIRPAVRAEGRLDLWQLAIKPGKPLAFGAIRRADHGKADEALFMGLPGNPVSGFVTFVLAVAPVVRILQGLPGKALAASPMRADFDWSRPDKRREFLRVRRNASGGLDLFANQSSGVLTSAVWADGLVDNPPGQAIRRGDTVGFLAMDGLIGR
ncbi:MAG: molybdopterin molybdotransferase MoeA [Aquincola sp.]|nr:molybdopterin molybdotransferase MoeA [Aquincola sp.]